MAWALASEKILTKTKDIITKIPNFVISIIYVALFIMVLRLINMIPFKKKRSRRTSVPRRNPYYLNYRRGETRAQNLRNKRKGKYYSQKYEYEAVTGQPYKKIYGKSKYF